MRQLENGVLAFFEVESGVRSYSADPDGEITHPFAGGLQRSTTAGGLAHQYGLAAGGQLLGERAGGGATLFLVGHQQNS